MTKVNVDLPANYITVLEEIKQSRLKTIDIATSCGRIAYSYQTLPKDIAKYLPSEQELKNIFKDTQN